MPDDQVDEEGAFTDTMMEASVPAFQMGGRVERTGIALVHEGEYIMPAPGSEAQITTYDQANEVVINYYFPVEIEIIGTLSDEQIRSVTECVFDELSRELDSRI